MRWCLCKSALTALDNARFRPVPFAQLTCPVCHQPLRQSVIGENRIRRHFSCSSCGYWVILENDHIRHAILNSEKSGKCQIPGSGFGGGYFTAITGELTLYCRERDRKRLKAEVGGIV